MAIWMDRHGDKWAGRYRWGARGLMTYAAVQDYKSYQDAAKLSEQTGNPYYKEKRASEIAGGWGAAWAGAKAGSMAGIKFGAAVSRFIPNPLVGAGVTLLSGFVGGVIGGGAAYIGGSKAGGALYDTFGTHKPNGG